VERHRELAQPTIFVAADEHNVMTFFQTEAFQIQTHNPGPELTVLPARVREEIGTERGKPVE
jgi:hypothetical protein